MNTDVIPDVAALGLDPMGVGLKNTLFMTLVCVVFMFHLVILLSPSNYCCSFSICSLIFVAALGLDPMDVGIESHCF
jgi:hypothetical protein